jgi:predicted nucleic acid-binding protein
MNVMLKSEEIKALFAQFENASAEIEGVECWSARELQALSLADTIQADYILTGDKDLLTFQFHNQTKMVTYNEFVAQYL